MSIPAGTKFHGVAPGVETENKGSATANANRDVYTIEEIGSVGTSDVYTLVSATDGSNVDLTLDATSGLDSTVQLTAGQHITITQTGGNNITINGGGGPGGVTILEPEFVTATPGGSYTINTTKDIIDVSWSGGTGDFTLTLPSAAAIPYRKIRIVNDGTVTANERVNVTAIGGETIDGASDYTINKAYNGIAVWSDGTEWIVIQAKAT